MGREGLNYWQILVLAAVRLGCNLDYDKLQNLAEEHRSLRQIMGVGDWDDRRDFSWRRIHDKVRLLQPATIEKISHPVVESAIAALQAGNGLERCRDKGELGFAWYLALGILGRNLHTLGKLLIAQEAPACEAARSRRQPSAA